MHMYTRLFVLPSVALKVMNTWEIWEPLLLAFSPDVHYTIACQYMQATLNAPITLNIL